MRLEKLSRSPRVILVGPPGCGKTTQAKIIADKFGLSLVSVFDLLIKEIKAKTKNSLKVLEALESGEPIPDDIIIPIVSNRLKQSDCSLNGWVLDGYPSTPEQITKLKEMRLKPSLVILFEC